MFCRLKHLIFVFSPANIKFGFVFAYVIFDLDLMKFENFKVFI